MVVILVQTINNQTENLSSCYLFFMLTSPAHFVKLTQITQVTNMSQTSDNNINIFIDMSVLFHLSHVIEIDMSSIINTAADAIDHMIKF